MTVQELREKMAYLNGREAVVMLMDDGSFCPIEVEVIIAGIGEGARRFILIGPVEHEDMDDIHDSGAQVEL